MRNTWAARYPDLSGKAVVVAGSSARLLEPVRGLAANGALIAVVADDRAVVSAAVEIAESLGRAVLGMTVDAASASVWERITSHIEQRLGPIDVLLACGETGLRRACIDALVPDMAARGRGVVIEVHEGDDAPAVGLPGTASAAGVRHRVIRGEGLSDIDVSAAALLCASDTLAVSRLSVQSVGAQAASNAASISSRRAGSSTGPPSGSAR